MRSFEVDVFHAALNAAYTMLGYANGYSAKLGTLEIPKQGFMVALRTLGIYEHLQDVNIGQMRQKEYLIDELNIEDLYIGSFRDPDDGKYFFELSVNLLDFDTAIKWGKKNNQRYIYDVTNNCNIAINN